MIHRRKPCAALCAFGLILVCCVRAHAGVFLFSPQCNTYWQDCCHCPENSEMCNNWGLSAPFPACPPLPTAADAVAIDSPCIIDAPAVAGTLDQFGGSLTLEGGSLAIGEIAHIFGPLNWSAGEIVRAPSTVGAVARLEGAITLSGPDEKAVGSSGDFRVTLLADLTWSGEGDLLIGGPPSDVEPPAVIELAENRTFTIATDADIVSSGPVPGTFENAGTIVKAGTPGASEWFVRLINDGLVHVQDGELRLTGGGASAGEFRIDSASKLLFAPQLTFEFKPGIAFTGDADPILSGAPGAVVVNDVVSLRRFRVVNGGTISNASEGGHVVITELLQLVGANIRAPMTIAPGARLENIGINDSSTGDLFVEGTADLFNGSLIAEDGEIAVREGGVVNLRDGASLHSSGVAVKPIRNAGTVQKPSGSGTARILGDFGTIVINDAGGLVHVGAGTLEFGEMNLTTTGGQWQIDAGAYIVAPGSFQGDFELVSGMLAGAGTLAVGRVANSGGVVAPDGVFTIAAAPGAARAGDYLQLPGGMLEIDVAGLEPGAAHDQLVVDGQATLSGGLRLSLDDFVPEEGDAITILSASSIVGEFSSIEVINLPVGIEPSATYGVSSVTISFTAGGPPDGGNNNANDNAPGDNANTNGNPGRGNVNDNGVGPPGPVPFGAECGQACGGAGAMLPLLALYMGIAVVRARRRR